MSPIKLPKLIPHAYEWLVKIWRVISSTYLLIYYHQPTARMPPVRPSVYPPDLSASPLIRPPTRPFVFLSASPAHRPTNSSVRQSARSCRPHRSACQTSARPPVRPPYSPSALQSVRPSAAQPVSSLAR